MKMIKASIIGASGYTGAELIRLLYEHPNAEIVSLIADSNAGKEIEEIYPHLASKGLPKLIKLDQADLSEIDVAFCCLPHATSQEIIKSLPEDLKVIDLSADFRLEDSAAYQEWYGKPHAATDLQKEAVYGLSEIYREKVKAARLVACPGCYPTSVLLPLLPLLEAGVVDKENIIVDSKSGITGAGRSAKVANLFAEINDNIKAYGIGGHRHIAEIEQELGNAASDKVQITFTPHVIPMNRGILSVIYVSGKAADISSTLENKYKDEVFVDVKTDGSVPTTRDVYGTNNNIISVFEDRVPGRAIIVSVIDNLVKGASGQAVQNMNLMFDLAEITGLDKVPVFP